MSDNINIVKRYISNNITKCNYRNPEYIVWHYTAGTTSKKGAALDNATWFNNPSAQASADFVVDDYYIVQMNGAINTQYCWAVGGGRYNTKGGQLYGIATNKNCISIEICSNNSSGKITYPNDPRYSVTEASLNNALKLTWYLMDKYNIDADHVVEHYMINGKPCIGIIGWNADSGSDSEWKKWHDKIKNRNGVIVSDPYPTISSDRYVVASNYSANKYTDQHNTFNILDNAKKDCDTAMKELNKTFNVYDTKDNNKIIYTSNFDPNNRHTQTSELKNLSDKDAAMKLLEIVKPIALKYNLFPSVITAQCILESGFGHSTELSTYNNICGMKCELLNSQWTGSTWDGKSRVRIKTPEEYIEGQIVYIYDYFRVYHCIEDCVNDLCAFFTSLPKYVNGGIMNAKDYKEQITITSTLGYATDKSYIQKICSIIERFTLDKYDKDKYDKIDTDFEEPDVSVTPLPETDKFYRVGTTWKNGNCVNQIGAYTVLDNAKKVAADKSGYKVFDWDGNVVFPVTELPTTSISYYRVGTAWEDGKCVKQLGAYTNLDNAKKKADDYGFKVFDDTGNVVYTAKPLTIPELAVKWAIDTANDNSHGYDNTKGSRGGTPDYACSSFVGAAYKFAGVDLPDPATIYTAKMDKIFAPKGFKKITSGINFKTGKGLELGDVLVTPNKHTEIYVGNGKLAGARGNANSGKPENGKAGDQSGSEIAVSAYWNYPWSFVLRYVGDEKHSTPSTSNTYVVQAGLFSLKANADNLVKQLKSKGFNAIIKTSGNNYIVKCGSFSIKENAEALKDKLIAAGFSAIVK